MITQYRHAPDRYDCPFCRIALGIGDGAPHTVPSDIVFHNEWATAFISSMWWPNNPGHVIIIPNQHVENIYEMPYEIGAQIHDATRQIAIAFKEVYGCDGTSTRQHNEPAGYQEIFHYHLHIFPRYYNDYLYDLTHRRRQTTPEERLPYAEKLRAHFDSR